MGERRNNESAAGNRERGQMMVMTALLFPILLGMTGLAVDFGFGYAQRRQVQNAADSAALAGAAALGRHYLYTGNGGSDNPFGLTAITGATVLQEITSAAASTVQPYPLPSSAPAWPSGTGDSLTAYWILTNAQSPPTHTLGAQVGAGAIPANAAGVQVEARLRQDTLFARVLGACCDHMDVYGGARSIIYPLASAGGAPFIVCGSYANAVHGAWAVMDANGNNLDPGGNRPGFKKLQILTDTNPPTIKYNTSVALPDGTTRTGFLNWTFRVHDEAIGHQGGQDPVEADCNAGTQYKGNADPNDICDAVGSTQLPCLLAGQNGTRAGPTRNRVYGLPGCAKDQGFGLCVAVLPIANGYQSSQLRVVTYGCFRLSELGANTHNGQLIGACAADGEVDAFKGFDPNNPGAFNWKLAPMP